ncbi:hypothetical protein M885DRAFT_568237 [Pelagophyceae sp. CCMP2097]|nr:hypothetical protein M885DRAFT_568237 [Pelagophyceae sp. CCMP2097]
MALGCGSASSEQLVRGGDADLDLSSYYAALDSARLLLDSLDQDAPAGALAASAAAVTAARASAPAPPPPAAGAQAGRVSAPAGRGRDLVIGLAQEIALKQLAVFVGSLRQVSTADCVLFVDEFSASAALDALTQQHRVEVVKYVPAKLEPELMRSYHPSSFRWPLISAYLEQIESRGYRGVLMADVRDSAFQRDPFEAMLAHEEAVFFAFHGVESKTIGECGWNGGWIRDCFGEKKRIALAKKPIARIRRRRGYVCSGVSLATFSEARLYAQQMGTVLGDAAFAKWVPREALVVLVHEQRISGLRLISQRTGLVANLQARVARIDKNLVRNPKGDLVAVVHQYDRFPDLAAYYYQKYAPAAASAPKLSLAAACQRYTVKPDLDLFKGKCDLRAAGGSSPAECCELCDSADGCRGWTHAGTLCYFKTCSTPVTNIAIKGATSGYLA